LKPRATFTKFEGQLQQLVQLREDILKLKEVKTDREEYIIPKRPQKIEFVIETIKVLVF